MTMPTAAQIEADVAQPTYQVRVHDGAAWVDVSSDVLDVSGEYRATAAAGDGNGFGVAATPRQRVRFARERYGLPWDRRPIEIRLGFGGVNPLHFVGLIDELEQNRAEGTWTAVGYQALIAAVPEIRSPLLFRRPIFTATTVTSNENPDDAGWRGGLGNLVLWRAGGRPLEQAATYPNAIFYYSCETAILAPEWSWINGGDGARVLDELCRAAGGVVYQDTDGVVRYQEPLTFAEGTPQIHYTDSAAALTAAGRVAGGYAQYGDIRRQAKTRRHVVDVVRCSFVQRRLQGMQEIYSDKIPRLIEAGQSLPVILDLQLPCYRADRVEASAGTLRGAVVTPSQVPISLGQRFAQQLHVVITNTLAEPIGLYDLRAYGQPLVAGEEGSISYGTPVGQYPRSAAVPSSVYIQSRSYGERLCHLEWDFRHNPRPVVELSGCGFDPRRRLGQLVLLTSADLGLAAVPHRVIGITPSHTGVAMDLTLVDVADLPRASDFYQVGAAFGAGAQLAY